MDRLKLKLTLGRLSILLGVVLNIVFILQLLPQNRVLAIVLIALVSAIIGYIKRYMYTIHKEATNPNGDFEQKLRKLAKLKEDGLINEEEFSKKREEIMNQKW